MKKIFLIDGSGFLYRAYYAFPSLTDRDWHNVNVIYWFLRMFLKIIQEKPDYLLIARDAPVKTFRHQEYPEYKANRKKMDDDFKSQIPFTKEIIQKLQVPSLSIDGYEADDIIATIAKLFKSDSDLTVDIYSSDKDLKQLLDSNVFCVDPMKNIRIDTNSFIKEFLFEPKYMLDYLTLVWDASDNIKWVAWIWPKKASELIKKYQTIDNIYSHLDELSPDIRQKLEDSRDIAIFARSLVELKDIPELQIHNIEQTKFELNFDVYKKVLVQEYWFASFEKTLDEVKKKLLIPQQSSLF